MANVRVEFINESTILDDNEVKSVIPALQIQVRRDFLPQWGIGADPVFLSNKSKSKPHAWKIAVLDDSDQAAVLGYHEYRHKGMPMGRVFARTDKKLGHSWTVTASHELLEMLADPDINLFAQGHGHKGILYAYEICDPCEPDEFGYRIDGVLVSDFVYPTWFESFHKGGSSQFDHTKHIHRPFQKLPGGHADAYDIRPHKTNPKKHGRALALIDGRKERVRLRVSLIRRM